MGPFLPAEQRLRVPTQSKIAFRASGAA